MVGEISKDEAEETQYLFDSLIHETRLKVVIFFFFVFVTDLPLWTSQAKF